MPAVQRIKHSPSADNSRSGNAPSEPLRVGYPKVNEPPTDLLDYTLMCYGQKGAGKTSLFAQADRSVVAMAEVLRHNLRIRQYPEADSGQQFTYALHLAQRDYFCSLPENKRPKAVVHDTIDRIYDLLLDHVRIQCGFKTLEQFEWSTWETVDSELGSLLLSYREHGISPIFLSHAKQRELEVETEVGSASLAFTAPTCKPRCWKFLKMVVDVAMYYGYIGYRRALFFSGSEHLWSANGCPENFLDAETGKPLTAIFAGENPKETWELLQLAFKNELVSDWHPAGIEEAAPVTEEPVAISEPASPRKRKK